MISRLIKTLIGTLLAVSAALALVWPPRRVDSAPPDFIHVQYWEKWTGVEADHMRSIIDEFNNTVGKQKKIVVDYTAMGSVDQKTLVATAGGVPPDVAGMWDLQLIQYAAKDALEPLDSLAAEYGISAETYKPIYWNGCRWNGRLWALCSTPWATFLYYNKQAILNHANDIRAAGLDPNRLPRTIEELDKLAFALTEWETVNGRKRIARSGFQPMEPGWYVTEFQNFFGGDSFDEKLQTIQFLSEPEINAMKWIASYSEKYGKTEVSDFRSGLGGFSSDQSPFMTRQLAMTHQGSWMYNFIENLNPGMNRWHVPAEKLAREKAFAELRDGMTRDNAIKLLGEPMKADAPAGLALASVSPVRSEEASPRQALQRAQQVEETWDAGTRIITLQFSDGKLSTRRMEMIPAKDRQQYCEWGCSIFPSGVPGSSGATYCGFDALAIPRTSKHKREAFEFIAYINRPEVAEKLAMMQCSISPLKKVSENYLMHHPNPYIALVEEAANGPTAFGTVHVPIFTQIYDELTNVAQTCSLLNASPRDALAEAQARVESTWNEYQRVAKLREAAQ